VSTDIQKSMSNRKYKCTSKGYCYKPGTGGNLGYQYPCESSADCAPLDDSDLFCSSQSDDVKDYMTFGSTGDTGCKDLPYEYAADYNCPFGTMQLVNYPDNLFGFPDWDKIEDDYGFTPAFVCVAQPKVQVLDNWGWCSGSCVSKNYGGRYTQATTVKGDGCYDDFSSYVGDCDISIPLIPAWVPYNGYIVVIPSPP